MISTLAAEITTRPRAGFFVHGFGLAFAGLFFAHSVPIPGSALLGGDSYRPGLFLQTARLMASVILRFGDGLSQQAGNLIPCRIGGEWQTWSRNANESISGAADRHEALDGIRWPRVAIDGLFFGVTYLLTLGYQPQRDHCLKARRKDEERAEQTLLTGELIDSLRAYDE